MTVIAAVRGALPDHVHTQEEITTVFADVVLGGTSGRTDRTAVVERLHASAQVRTRHLALPLESYRSLGGFSESNDVFIDVGVQLGERAVRDALDAAALLPTDIDMVMAVSVTGVAAPSLDARLVPRLGLRPDVKRVPVFGLGCVAGAAGVSRLHDYLVGHPDDVAVLLAVELCSLTMQREDASMANVVASGLFGDGAAAVVMVGSRRAERMGLAAGGTPTVVDTRSRMYPDTDRVMGWDIGTTGFRIVLDATVPDVVEKYLRADVDSFLADHAMTVADVGTWVAHPGGPKVLQAMSRALDLTAGALDVTWGSLAAVGNLSSASVLQVLEQTIASGTATPGSAGVMLAMGPGFCAELVLLRW